jgi:DNA-binding MarR family transcriptional regulator
MLDSLRKIAKSELSIFLSTSYSLEVLCLFESMHFIPSFVNLFDQIESPKPKKATFDAFIRRLIAKGWIELVESNDRRAKGLRLSDKAQSLLNELNYKNP